MNDYKKTASRKTRNRLPFLLMLLAFLLVGANDAIFAADFGPLVGRWQRTDGGYLIEVRQIREDGRMEAGYYNPRPINVSRAQASIEGDRIKMELELRDRGYPGSRYTLIYSPEKDVLLGFYFHAPTGQNLEVVFFRRD